MKRKKNSKYIRTKLKYNLLSVILLSFSIGFNHMLVLNNTTN